MTCILTIVYFPKDVASYLVVRTLGTDSTHPLDHVNATEYAAPDSTLDTDSLRAIDHESRKPPAVVISPRFDASAMRGTQPETYFATSCDANFALAGEGIFSPPGSRSASPPTMRNPRVACFGGNTDDVAVVRKRG
ncbi:hypothetical protein JB92DRAFT_1687619 [Gautieria morchelliformis]|nr:hypothetical protein JB92DRAFT_1687619 [Gautieria morchelliformis]